MNGPTCRTILEHSSRSLCNRLHRYPLKNRQRALNLLATRLEKIRQLQVPTEGFERLVDREPGDVGRDLEQNTTRLAEIDRTEIVAILLFSRVSSVRTDQLFGHLRLLCVVGNTEGNVMH